MIDSPFACGCPSPLAFPPHRHRVVGHTGATPHGVQGLLPDAGVSPTATADEIKKAYRKLARKYHPDVSKEPDAVARMTAVNEANAVLSDPEKRAAYDRLAQEPRMQPGQDFRPPPHWDAGFEFSDGAGGQVALRRLQRLL